MIDFFIEIDRRPLDHSLGFHPRPTQTSFESPSPSSNCNNFKLRRPLDFGHNMKDQEAELLISCNLIGENRRPLIKQLPQLSWDLSISPLRA